ncbi:hypothetical protein X474_13165 [Dethiosulfatarculus sandiegensis]|uniref:Uncharacterized protein n=1 Tax=Dethiosulfatarculus sandiegensis TaxID=1429043 RepID=A0A0D2HUA8_9BACT|nr:hypothetical protein X474_13165 [Dethiosulfatarculus sandiegensis]
MSGLFSTQTRYRFSFDNRLKAPDLTSKTNLFFAGRFTYDLQKTIPITTAKCSRLNKKATSQLRTVFPLFFGQFSTERAKGGPALIYYF